MLIRQQIFETLNKTLCPTHLEIMDESHLHANHHQSPNTGESHFRIVIVAKSFQGFSRVERHRLVYEALATLLRDSIHALRLKTMTPEEFNAEA